MPGMLNITIDDQSAVVSEDLTIMKAAENLGISIPSICFHDYCTSNALCRLCVVEVEGSRTLVASCIAKVSEGMIIHTQTERVRRARRTILEMLASKVDLDDAPEILGFIQDYGVNTSRFPEAAHPRLPILDDNPMFIRDYARCVLCWRCVQVCAEDAQYAYAINFAARGFNTTISTYYDLPLPETTCVFCGQCIGVCPTGALRPKREWLLEIGYSPQQVMEMTHSQRNKTPVAGQQVSPTLEGGHHD